MNGFNRTLDSLDTITGNANAIAQMSFDVAGNTHYVAILAITAVIMGSIIVFLAVKVLDLYFDMEAVQDTLDGLEEANEELRGFIKVALTGDYYEEPKQKEEIPDADFKVVIAEKAKELEDKFIANKGLKKPPHIKSRHPSRKPIIEPGSAADDSRTDIMIEKKTPTKAGWDELTEKVSKKKVVQVKGMFT